MIVQLRLRHRDRAVVDVRSVALIIHVKIRRLPNTEHVKPMLGKRKVITVFCYTVSRKQPVNESLLLRRIERTTIRETVEVKRSVCDRQIDRLKRRAAFPVTCAEMLNVKLHADLVKQAQRDGISILAKCSHILGKSLLQYRFSGVNPILRQQNARSAQQRQLKQSLSADKCVA